MQISFDVTYFNLTECEQKLFDRSWATQFADYIIPLIYEERFSVLYSDKAPRPNTPVNVLAGDISLSELRKQTDDVIYESLLLMSAISVNCIINVRTWNEIVCRPCLNFFSFTLQKGVMDWAL